MTKPHEHDWMSVNEVARRTGRSRQWVHQRIHDGTFTSERKGRRIDVKGGSVRIWMLREMFNLIQRASHLNLNLSYENESD